MIKTTKKIMREVNKSEMLEMLENLEGKDIAISVNGMLNTYILLYNVEIDFNADNTADGAIEFADNLAEMFFDFNINFIEYAETFWGDDLTIHLKNGQVLVVDELI